MDQILSGWFTEINEGQSLSLQVEKVLHHEKSKYQDILIFQRFVHVGNCGWGWVCMCVCTVCGVPACTLSLEISDAQNSTKNRSLAAMAMPQCLGIRK